MQTCLVFLHLIPMLRPLGAIVLKVLGHNEPFVYILFYFKVEEYKYIYAFWRKVDQRLFLNMTWSIAKHGKPRIKNLQIIRTNDPHVDFSCTGVEIIPKKLCVKIESCVRFSNIYIIMCILLHIKTLILRSILQRVSVTSKSVEQN